MPKRKTKLYSRPKKIYDTVRIKEENELVKRYGLKNKREIWRADFAIGKIRNIAKKLITASEEEKQEFINRQKAKGFAVETIADILGLNKEDYLKRRLESVVVAKQLAKTPKQARQFITHRYITINDNIVNSPSHITTVEEEATVKLTLTLKPKKKASPDVPSEEGKEKAEAPKEEEKPVDEKPEEEGKEESKPEVKGEAK